MDLNVDNYSTNELINALQITQNEGQNDIASITITHLQKCLLAKIEKIKLIDNVETDLPVSKENLIEFYTKAFFKVVNDRNMISELRTSQTNGAIQEENANMNNMNEVQEKKEYRDAYGNAAGNVYNTSYANPNQASASIQGKLLEPMPQTHVVQENSRYQQLPGL